MTQSSHTDLDWDFEPYLSFPFLYTIPIFEGSQNSPKKIQDDGDANITPWIFGNNWFIFFNSELFFKIKFLLMKQKH